MIDLPFSCAMLVMEGMDARTRSGPWSSWPSTVTGSWELKRKLSALSTVAVRISYWPSRRDWKAAVLLGT